MAAKPVGTTGNFDLALLEEGRATTTIRQQWIVAFHTNLQGADGNMMARKNARQHASQVNRIFNKIDPSGCNLDAITTEHRHIQ